MLHSQSHKKFSVTNQRPARLLDKEMGKAGEEMDEFEQLYRRYYRDVYLYLCTLADDRSVAEDLTAETFLHAYTSIGKFRGDCDIRTWLCRIAHIVK